MDLENKKRIVASAIAGAAAVAPAASVAQSVTGNRHDYTAPVILFEEYKAFRINDELEAAKKGADLQKDTEACYTNPPPVAQQGQALATIKPTEAKKGNKYAGKNIQDLSADAVAIEKMPENTPKEREAKDAARAEIQDALSALVTNSAAANQKSKPPAPASFAPVIPSAGDKKAIAMAEAHNRQMQYSNNPAIQACLANVDAKYQHSSTPMQIVYQNEQFEDAGKMLSRGARTVHVILTDGSRYNVVSKQGAYGARAVSLEDAMKMAAVSRSVAPEYDPKGQAGAMQGGEISPVDKAIGIAEQIRRAAEAAKGNTR